MECIPITINKEIKCTPIKELEKMKRIKICYARVSSIGQKEDLERQKNLLREKYPNHEIIEDIGSGINLTKKGIQKIIELGIEGKVEEIVVAHKDRLARFGYDLIEHIIKRYSGGKIIIINKDVIEIIKDDDIEIGRPSCIIQTKEEEKIKQNIIEKINN